MKYKFCAFTLCLASSAMMATGQIQPANHLVISELGVYATSGYSNVPTSAEFTEIYNPTAAPIDLTNYYLSDHELHFDLPSIVAGQRDNTLSNGSDFLLQFPAGTSIPAGGVVVVASSGSALIEAYFDNNVDNFANQAGAPQLFEVYDSSPNYPNMENNYNRSSADYPLVDPVPVAVNEDADNMSHSDAGENCVLFYWDGTSSLVKDVDIVQWLQVGQTWGVSTNQYADKSGRSGQGPNGAPQESYALDFGTPDGRTVWYPDWPAAENQAGQLVRRSLLEIGETHNEFNGNGITGDDETMEVNTLTWEMHRGAPTNASPGITHFTPSATNQPPVLGRPQRNLQFPSTNQTVHVTIPIYDNGAFTASLMVDKGFGFAPVNMTNEGGDNYGADISTAGLAPETRVKWYVTVTDAGGLTTTEGDKHNYQPIFKPFVTDFPGYHVFMIEPTTPYEAGDMIISEVNYNPHGANNYHHCQYFEIYNPAATPFDVGGFVVTTDFQDGDIQEPTVFRIPLGTVIPANGYIVVAGFESVFMRNYPGMDESLVVDAGIRPSNSFIAHAGSNIRFFSPNHFDFDDNPVPDASAFKTFSYGNEAPWPEGRTGLASGTPTAGNTGLAIELTELTSAAESDPTKWVLGTEYNGTPLALNTAMRTGDVAVTAVSRDIVYPSTGQVVTITATPTGSTPISTVTAMVDSGSGFQPFPMATSDGGLTYSGPIGPFATDGTLVKYYVIATDENSNTGTFPYNAPVTILPFRVENVPSLTNDIVINEIMYDPSGGDNAGYPEYVELYNKSAEPVDLSYYQFGVTLRLDDTSTRLLPEGTIIQPGEYLVLSGRGQLLLETYLGPYPTHFRNTFGPPTPDQVHELGWSDGSKLSNGDASTIYFVHANETVIYSGPDGTNGVPFISLPVRKSDGWPAEGATLNGPSYELVDYTSDFTNPANWEVSLSFNGTPGTRNSVAPPPATVSDWTLY